MANKIWGVLAIPFLMIFALVVVIAMLLSSLSGIAGAQECQPVTAESAPFGWPTDKHEVDQGWQDPDENGASHSGIDFKVDQGSNVYAVADGKVTSISDDTVVITHSSGTQTRTKFFRSIKVTVGAQVKRGDQIGSSGTGDETTPGDSGAHVHFELWVDKDGKGKYENSKPPADAFGDEVPASTGGCGCGGGGPLSGSNNEQKAFNFWVTNGYTKEQAAGIVGNMVSESGVEPQRLNATAPGVITTPQQALNIPRAWGLVQWYPGSKFINAAKGLGADYNQMATLEYQLGFVKNQLVGSGPLNEKPAGDAVRATKTVEDAAFTFGFKFERFTLNPSDPEFDRRRANAKRIYGQFAGSAPAGGAAGADSCGAGSGNIAAVAKNLAWPQGGHDGTSPSLAKQEFRDALEKYNDPGGYLAYTDCGRFVSTVLHMSGADPKFPLVSTGVQWNYMMNSPLYDHWHAVPPGGMKPGDVLNGGGHTYLFVGPWGDGGGYDSASGSLGDHVPEASHLYSVGQQFWVFRLKNAGTPPTTQPKS